MQQQLLFEVELKVPRHEVREVKVEAISPLVYARSSYGYCKECGSEISVPGLNASLCSKGDRTCGSSGWISNKQIAPVPPTLGGAS